MKIPKWIRRRRLIRKIRIRLPLFHPDYGFNLYWDIEPGYYKSVDYDVNTGKAINKDFVPRPRVYQKAKGMIRGTNVLRYNYGLRKFEATLAVWN